MIIFLPLTRYSRKKSVFWRSDFLNKISRLAPVQNTQSVVCLEIYLPTMPRKKIEDIVSKGPKKNKSSEFRAQFGSHHLGSAESRVRTENLNKGRLGGGNSLSNREVSHSKTREGVNWRSRFIKLGIFVGGILALVLIFLMIFDKATLKIVPSERTMELDEHFIAKTGAGHPDLSFSVMERSGEEIKTVEATEVEHVDRRSSGTIIVYNNYGSASQRLITNTRFETPDGFIYRIREPIVVPGQIKKDGKTAPGSLEVVVYADQPGAEYNIGLTDFTVPGFRGLPQYEKFYARSKGEMSGGFSGIVKTISQKEREKIKAELQTNISRKLLEDAHSQKPANFVLFDDSVFIEFGEEGEAEQKNVNENNVSITERGNLSGVLFNEEELENYIGRVLIPTLKDEERVSIQGLEDIDFEFENRTRVDLSTDSDISFTLKGRAHIVWVFDEEKLKKDLLGKPKKELTDILAQFPSIKKAELVFRPFWKRFFPKDVKDIHIELLTGV